MTLQTILFNLAKIALQQKLKIKGKGQATKSYNQSPDEKVLLEFKLPKKTARDQEDFQKFYFPSFPDSSEKTKKRKREDEEEKEEVETKQNYNYKPKKKLLKLNK